MSNDRLDEILEKLALECWVAGNRNEALSINGNFGARLIQAKTAINQLINDAVVAAELRVWKYVAKTPVSSFTITDLDADSTGNTDYLDYHYCPPRKYVNEKIKQLSEKE